MTLFWGLQCFSYKLSRHSSFVIQQLWCIFSCIHGLWNHVSGLLYVAVAWILGWSLLRECSSQIITLLHWILFNLPLSSSWDYWPWLVLLSLPLHTCLPFLLYLVYQSLHLAESQRYLVLSYWYKKSKKTQLKVLYTPNWLFLLCCASLGLLETLRVFSARYSHIPMFTLAAGSLFGFIELVSGEVWCWHCLNFHSLSECFVLWIAIPCT